MSLNDNLSAKGISNFASPADQLITLTIGQLVDLLKEAVREAIQPLQAEVSDLQATVASQKEELAAMREKLASIESREEQDIDRICLDIAQDRQRIARLERPEKEPQPMQKDRAEILRALLAANGGKMLAKVARQKMHLPKNRFSELLDNCAFLECKPLHSDRRKMIIILKSELVPRN